MQRTLHVLRLDDGQRAGVSELLQRETIGTLEGVRRQDAAVRVVVGVQRLFDVGRTFPGPAEQLSGAEHRDRIKNLWDSSAKPKSARLNADKCLLVVN